MKDSDPKLIVTVPELWEKVKGFNLPTIMLSKGSSPIEARLKILTFYDLISLSGSASDFPLVNVKHNDIAALLYSSRTIGRSIGVILTRKNFIIASLMVAMDQDMVGEMHNIFMCVLPMFHSKMYLGSNGGSVFEISLCFWDLDDKFIILIFFVSSWCFDSIWLIFFFFWIFCFCFLI